MGKQAGKVITIQWELLVIAGQDVGILIPHLFAMGNPIHMTIGTARGGIDAIASDSPLFVGRPGSYGDRASHFAIQQCDCLLILGCRLSGSTTGYYPQRFGQNAYKIMVDIDQKELEKPDVPIERKLYMDVKLCLERLSGPTPRKRSFI